MMIYGIFGNQCHRIPVLTCILLLVSFWFQVCNEKHIFLYLPFVLFKNNSLTLSETAWVIVRTFNMLFSFLLALHFVRKLYIILFLYQISICIITGIICNGTVKRSTALSKRPYSYISTIIYFWKTFSFVFDFYQVYIAHSQSIMDFFCFNTFYFKLLGYTWIYLT